MKNYKKPDIEINKIVTSEIANEGGLGSWLEGNKVYDPGITTFVYQS